MKTRIRLTWLKMGDVIRNGDYCWDKRGNPVKVYYSMDWDRIKITNEHHPHFRIIKHLRP